MGRRSLIIYLAHPFVIVALDHMAPELRQSWVWLAFPIYAATSFAAAAFAANLLCDSGTRRTRARHKFYARIRGVDIPLDLQCRNNVNAVVKMTVELGGKIDCSLESNRISLRRIP